MPNGNATIESRRFGVEIEVEGISTDRARRELRLPTGWKVTSDGSLYDGSEIVSPPLTLGDFGQVEQVLNLLKRHGARVSEQCSVHVHIDGNGFDLEGIKRLVQNTRAYEPWIYQIARGADAEHRGRNGNHYRYRQGLSSGLVSCHPNEDTLPSSSPKGHTSPPGPLSCRRGGR